MHAVIKESAACHMITVHNVAFQLRLMRNVRESIISGRGSLQPVEDQYKVLQGDTSRWTKPPVDMKTKVAF